MSIDRPLMISTGLTFGTISRCSVSAMESFRTRSTLTWSRRSSAVRLFRLCSHTRCSCRRICCRKRDSSRRGGGGRRGHV